MYITFIFKTQKNVELTFVESNVRFLSLAKIHFFSSLQQGCVQLLFLKYLGYSRYQILSLHSKHINYITPDKPMYFLLLQLTSFVTNFHIYSQAVIQFSNSDTTGHIDTQVRYFKFLSHIFGSVLI